MARYWGCSHPCGSATANRRHPPCAVIVLIPFAGYRRARMGSDGDELERLRRRRQTDADLIARLRDEVRDASERADTASEQRRADQALIARLREDAGVHDSVLLELRERLTVAENELSDLRAIRDALTPAELPDCPGLRLSVSFAPATSRVSGDFYLAERGPDDTTVIAVGDVVGKGIPAARDAAFLRTALATSARFTTDPCQLLAWANHAYTERTTPLMRFATVACLVFDPAEQSVRFALAGHPAPIRLGSGEELDVACRAIPLGIDAGFQCERSETRLAPGEGVLLYTDGLTEARRGDEFFGIDRAREHVRTHQDRPSGTLLDSLRDAATDFAGGAVTDDLCLVSVCAT